MPETLSYTFYGDPQRKPDTPHKDAPQVPEPYIAAPQLVQAVNLAMFLRRPLLLEGEAGCGKTRLAYAVAYELGLPLYVWPVRSTTRAQDGLYTYDAILRLHDTQVVQYATRQADASPPTTKPPDPSDPKTYRQFGALGKAFQVQEHPAVVLIDEIDKADIDFPNDLLGVLDDPWTFEILETKETIQAHHTPIVIITSNKEKGNLPAPFLRRCIYHYVEFPGQNELQEIVQAHYTTRNITHPEDKLISASIARFLQIRQHGGLYKKPGTSEFLDWLRALNQFNPNWQPQTFSSEEENATIDTVLDVPHPEVVFKLRSDWQRMMQARKRM